MTADGALACLPHGTPYSARKRPVQPTATTHTLHIHRCRLLAAAPLRTHSQTPLVIVCDSGCTSSDAYAHCSVSSQVTAKGMASIGQGAPDNGDRTCALSHRPAHTTHALRGTKLEVTLLPHTAGTTSHARQAFRARYGHASTATWALSSLRGYSGSGPCTRHRACASATSRGSGGSSHR